MGSVCGEILGGIKVERLYDDLVTGLNQAINFEKGTGEAKIYTYSKNGQDIDSKSFNEKDDSECLE